VIYKLEKIIRLLNTFYWIGLQITIINGKRSLDMYVMTKTNPLIHMPYHLKI